VLPWVFIFFKFRLDPTSDFLKGSAAAAVGWAGLQLADECILDDSFIKIIRGTRSPI
jgi:hypothetical protein